MATLFFDLDGTLLDIRRRHYAVYAEILIEMGIRPLPDGAYWHAGAKAKAPLHRRRAARYRRARFTARLLKRSSDPSLKLDTV